MPYKPNLIHRNNGYAKKKSQWCITVADETTCYSTAVKQNWSYNNSFWGLHILAGASTPSVLGVSTPPSSCRVHIAKFVGDSHGDWHGYPVAHWLSPFDKPGENVLRDWRDKGFISNSVFSRMHRGKKCVL